LGSSGSSSRRLLIAGAVLFAGAVVFANAVL